VDRAATEAYFGTRPRASQLGAWASAQSSEVAGRAELEAAYAEVEERFAGQDVPAPPHWGGYLVVPRLVEFWQGRRGRMHDRLVYARQDAGWSTRRLAP
ncbi:MAG: pyridoxal 5'-phosphate synthase, partial [Marmoricola sp.]